MSAVAGTTTSSATTVGQKVSMVVAKSGFVIPKNKLSGSLVPVSKGGKKPNQGLPGEGSVECEKRKTRWGPDPSLDEAVKKCRALAYQTRLDQVTEKLLSGNPNAEEDEEIPELNEPSSPRTTLKNTKFLELERREIIGEILTLNPSFKSPIDYKPLLKETKFRIPIEEYPGKKVLNILFGSKNENLKTLEMETGVRLRVFGTKPESSEEVEVRPHDLPFCKEINVLISAETYEKVDEAVSLLELLLENLSKEEHSSEVSPSSPPTYTGNQKNHSEPVASLDPPESQRESPLVPVPSAEDDGNPVPLAETPLETPPPLNTGAFLAPPQMRNVIPRQEFRHAAPMLRGTMGPMPVLPEPPRFMNPPMNHGGFPLPVYRPPEPNWHRFPPANNQMGAWNPRFPPPPFRPPFPGYFVPRGPPFPRNPARVPHRFPPFPGLLEHGAPRGVVQPVPRVSRIVYQPRHESNNVPPPQIYDPFSPTSAAVVRSVGNDMNLDDVS